MLQDPILIYVLSGSCMFVFLIFLNVLPFFVTCFCFAYRRLLHYFVYRRRWLGLGTPAEILVLLTYAAINLSIFFGSIAFSTLRLAGLRAGHLSLINLAPALAGPHLSFLADGLGVSLQTYKCLHRSTGVVSFLLLVCHLSAVAISRATFPMHTAQNLSGVIVCSPTIVQVYQGLTLHVKAASAFLVLLILTIPILRKPSYEMFLRIHQMLAFLIALSTLRHCWSSSILARSIMYTIFGVFLTVIIAQTVLTLYRNKALGFGLSRAVIVRDGDLIKVRLKLSRRVRVKAGQYIQLCIPSVSFWSFAQSHPFVVVSWREEAQDELDLLIQPRAGWTQDLFFQGDGAKPGEHDLQVHGMKSRVALFGGPYGCSVPIKNYSTILMFAYGFGVAAMIPYLKQVIHGNNTCKNYTQRVHLVWEAKDWSTFSAVYNCYPNNKFEDQVQAIAPFLNSILSDDIIENGYVSPTLCV
jgi:hypothetical protein